MGLNYYAGGTMTVAPVVSPVSTVPEPGTLALLGVGVLGAFVARKREQHAESLVFLRYRYETTGDVWRDNCSIEQSTVLPLKAKK